MSGPVVDARGVVCRFGDVEALAGVDFSVAAGEVHALLGPNGAGKTTLLRVLAGAITPVAGSVEVGGWTPNLLDTRGKRTIGIAPAGDRSFYLRISGFENLVFFGRLHGMDKRAARARATEALDAVGLGATGRKMVGLYSQGMKKRLSVARALLCDVPVLVLDEATHDVDAAGSEAIRDLAAARAAAGTAVIWATQLLDEIRGFAHAVTVLHQGRARFRGTVSALVATTTTQRFLVRVRAADGSHPEAAALRAVVGGRGDVEPTADADHVHLGLRDGVVLGDVLAAFAGAGVQVLSCREEQSLVEAALRSLTADEPAGSGA
jgi:ABC-2 type transport system ATP-binding protein